MTSTEVSPYPQSLRKPLERVDREIDRLIHSATYLKKVAMSFALCSNNYELIKQFDAQDMPFEDKSKDVIILFEAIHYIPDADKGTGRQEKLSAQTPCSGESFYSRN